MTTPIVLALYCLACLGTGIATQRLIGLYGAPGKRGLAFAASAFLMGQGVLACVWVAAGLAGGLGKPAVAAVALICCVTGLVLGRSVFRGAWQDARDAARWLLVADRPFQAVCALLFLAAFLFLCDAGVRGPLGDAEAFYMTYPKVIAAREDLVAMPGLYTPFSQIGLLAELHFAALMVLDGAVAAKLFVWPTAIAAGVELAALAAHAGAGWRGRWLAVAILFTSTSFTNHIWDGKVDIFAAAFGLAAIRWLLLEGERGAPAVRAAGLLAGFSIVSKLSYIPTLLPAAGLLIAWRAWSAVAGDGRAALRGTLWIGATFGLWTLLPWLATALKNGVLFGAPLAPFAGGITEGVFNQVWFAPEDTRRIIMSYPFALAFGRYPMQGGNVSFLLLAFLPLALYLASPLSSWRESRLAMITCAGLAGIVVWMTLRPSVIAPRYFFASVALLIPLAALAAERVYDREEPPRWLRAGILVTLASALFFVSFQHLRTPLAALRVMLGKSPPCEFAGSYCAPLTKVNDLAAAGERVYFAGYYGYWLRADLLQCQASVAELRRLEALPDAPARWSWLRERGFRYVVIDRASHGRVASLLAAGVASVSHAPVLETAELIVLEPKPGDRQPAPAARCVRSNADAWTVTETR